MITILSKLFLTTRDMEAPAARKAYGTLCSIVGILLNILLFAGKYFAGTISSSIAITADAFNNLSDAGSSFITLIGFWFAGKKPDIEHPFGHGRFEYISGLVVSITILLMGFEFAKGSIEKIITPDKVDTSFTAIIILIVSIGTKIYMAIYNHSFGKKINSSAMKATATDSMSDSIATFFVLISVLISKLWGYNLDGICGLLVAVFILYAGYSAVKETMEPLLGQAPDQEFVEAIKEIVLSHKEICGIHDLVVHDYGPGRRMISLHTEVPGDGDIFKIHDLIDRIETELNERLGCEAVIHMDPIEINNQVVIDAKNTVKNIIESMDETISIHDFRMVSGETHTNLIFDVVVPYTIDKSDDEVKEKIQKKISEYNNTYFAVIRIDREYSKAK